MCNLNTLVRFNRTFTIAVMAACLSSQVLAQAPAPAAPTPEQQAMRKEMEELNKQQLAAQQKAAQVATGTAPASA